VTLAVSPSGNEAAECAPPSRPNEQRQLGNVDAGGTEGMVDDVDGIFKAHLTVPPPMDRGDIPQDCNRSELLRRQVGFGSYGLSSSCPPSSAPSMQFAARPPHQLFLNAVGLAGSQSHGTGIMPPPHLSHLRQYEPDRASLYSSQLRLPQPFPQPPAPSNMTTMFSSDKSDAAHIRKAENCSLEESLDKTLYHEMNWTQDEFYIPCTHDPASDDLVLTDLCKFIPESPNPFHHRGAGRENDRRIFLSRKLTDVPSIAKMMNANTCHNNGWSAISSGKSIGKFGDVRYIRCAHGKARERSKSHKGLESSSTRPDLDERCRCVIPIQFDNKHERFFIRQNGGACLRHNDHFKTPKERSELCKRDLSDDLVDDITEKLKRNIPKDVLRELVEYETGRTLSASVISHLKKTMVVDEFKGGDASLSAGAATLKWLEEKPNVQFVAYFGRLEDAGDTVRVRKKVRRRRQCTSTTNCKGKASAKSAESDKGGTSSLDLTEDTGSIDISDDAKSFVKHVIKELTVGTPSTVHSAIRFSDPLQQRVRSRGEDERVQQSSSPAESSPVPSRMQSSRPESAGHRPAIAARCCSPADFVPVQPVL